MTKPPPPSHPPSGSAPESPVPETDPRFPSGPWTGFYLMDHAPGRHQMELHLSFRQGVMAGEGRDPIGAFLIRGRYSVDDGKCHWTKRYLGQHDVAYQGYNEGKGIWGLWEIPPTWKGGFHIWPEGMADPTKPRLAESVAPPVEATLELGEGLEEDLGVGVGAGTGVAEPEPAGAPRTAKGRLPGQ